MELVFDNQEFVFDPRVNRYRFKDSGKFVNGNQFRSLTRKLIKAQKVTINDLLAQRIEGTLDQGSWRERTLKSLKTLAIQSYVLERGGAQRMKPNDLDSITKHLQNQFKYFRNLSAQINQDLISDDEKYRRLQLYINNTGASDSIAQLNNHVTEGSYGYRVLGNAVPCPDCARYAALGLVKGFSLIAPGTLCVCGDHCDCSVYIFPDEFTAKEARRTGNLKGSTRLMRRRLSKKIT